MKMAKPSARDIEAAEELLQILQMLDARFGGPWSNPDAGASLSELLQDGAEEFDCDNITHLQTLYNNLARLLRNAPGFHGRVISGMCHVIMNEANQILDPESDCIDLHPRFQQMATEGERLRQSMLRLVTMHCAAAMKSQASDAELVQYLSAGIAQLEAECERLRGLLPEMPPRPPEGSGLPRYGLRWNGPQQPLAVPMDDGYWTPWHLAATQAHDHAEHDLAMVPQGYALVPVEPTPAMIRAAEEAHMPFGDMDIALRMAILAASEGGAA